MAKHNYDPEFVRELLDAAKRPPEAEFDNIEDLLRWLNVDFDAANTTL